MLPKNTFVILVVVTVFIPVALPTKQNTHEILQEDDDSGEITIADEEVPFIVKPEGSNAFPDDMKINNVIYDDSEIKARNLRINIEYEQNPVISMMMQTPAFNYIPKDQGDPFDFLRDSYPLPKGLTNPLSEYDYVIVGAGSSGCALAAKLTEGEPRSTVLLLEAGKPEMIFTDIPGIAPFFQQTDYAWQYRTERQEGICMGFVNEQCSWPRGRAVGGSSVINYMMYSRGRPQDWDRIAADGNYGWSYNDVLPYFINSERANLRHFRNSSYHGKDGEMSVTDVPFRTKLIKSFLKAGEELGHRTVDYNSPEGYGFGYVQGTLENGHRQSAAKAFLHPNKKRKNLHILPEARALKVLIDPQTKKAHSVLYVKNRLQYTVRASKEVILSAGPIASPQLLMLSGVGPEQHLNELGIPVIQNLKVGQTLYDHISFPGMVFLLNTSRLSFIIDKLVTSQSVAQWVQYGDGPATTLGGIEGIGYMKTNVSNELEDIPDVELMFIGGSIVSDGSVPKGLGITDQFYNSVFGQIDRHETFSIYPMPLHPKSKGYLKLKDTNPFHWPKIYSNYLTERSDVDTFIAAIRHIIKLSQTQPFQKYGARLHNTHYPTCNHYQFDTDLYWECAVRTLTMTVYDPIATCRMGPASDPDAVVDAELRVHGIAGLRVVDTGIIPRTISAHTHAPGVIIGLKAADLIKRGWAGK